MKLETIHTFFDKTKTFGIVGVSSNPKKFGRQVYDTLKIKGYNVVPVNPHALLIGEDECYKSILDLPENVERLIFLTSKSVTDNLLYDASKKGVSHIWVQQMSETKNTQKIADELNLEIITNHCVFMFTEPKGIHKFHKNILKLFGAFPK